MEEEEFIEEFRKLGITVEELKDTDGDESLQFTLPSGRKFQVYPTQHYAGYDMWTKGFNIREEA